MSCNASQFNGLRYQICKMFSGWHFFRLHLSKQYVILNDGTMNARNMNFYLKANHQTHSTNADYLNQNNWYELAICFIHHRCHQNAIAFFLNFKNYIWCVNILCGSYVLRGSVLYKAFLKHFSLVYGFVGIAQSHSLEFKSLFWQTISVPRMNFKRF